MTLAFATASQRNLILERLRAKSAQLLSEAGRLTSDIGLFETVRNELEMFRRRPIDSDDKIDCLRAVLVSPHKSIDDGLAGSDDHF